MADISGGLNDLGGALNLFGGAASDLISVHGYAAESRAYGQASAISKQNAASEDTIIGLTQASTALQETAAQRQLYKTVGGAKADVAAAGLQEHGSALDVIGSSMQQGALQQQLLQDQGLINVQQEKIQQQAFNVQASAYEGEQEQANATADAAKAGGAAKGAGGILGTIAGIAKLFF